MEIDNKKWAWFMERFVDERRDGDDDVMSWVGVERDDCDWMGIVGWEKMKIIKMLTVKCWFERDGCSIWYACFFNFPGGN